MKNPQLPCQECEALCCRYVMLEYPDPKSKQDVDYMQWIILHNKVNFLVTKGEDKRLCWQVKFKADCERIEDNRCQKYEQRPDICRSYPKQNKESCNYFKDALKKYDICISNIIELNDYLKEKKINFSKKNKTKKGYKLIFKQKTKVGLFEQLIETYNNYDKAVDEKKRRQKWYDFLKGIHYEITKS